MKSILQFLALEKILKNILRTPYPVTFTKIFPLSFYLYAGLNYVFHLYAGFSYLLRIAFDNLFSLLGCL